MESKQFCLILWIVTTLTGISYAQLGSGIGSGVRNSLSECTDGTFIQGIVECFASKFEQLLPSALSPPFSYAENTYNTGRHPLSENMKTLPKDSAIRNNYVLPQMSERLSSSHKKLLDVIYTAGQAALKQEREFMAIEKLKHVNLPELLYEYIVAIMEHNISPYLKVMSIRSQDFHSFEDIAEDEQCDRFCLGPIETFVCRICKRIASIIETVPGLIDSIQCLSQFSETDFEDSVQWIKCFYNCEDLIPISSCITDHFAQCNEWSIIGDVIIKGFAQFADLGSCKLNVVSERNITLEEGESAVVSFYNYMPPNAHCIDFTGLTDPLGMIRVFGKLMSAVLGTTIECTVRVEMSLQNYLHDLIPHISDTALDGLNVGRPKCHDRRALRQAVVGYHDYNINNTMETCVFPITDDNWNQTFHVPIWASIDLKNDDNVLTNFTIKLVAGGTVTHNEKLPVEIVDTDLVGSTLCQSSGDPHITTFDGHYYNNFYEGYFYLYRNTILSYQVQAIYQRCTPEGDASCTCAVAVKSGDDVFVVEKCRRTGQANDDTIMRTVIFVNNELTPGTRVFSKSDGAEIEVILPTGFRVSIVTSNAALSVYLNPSNYDFEQTEGLCGYFDGDSTNDLMFENGTIFDGEGSEERGQPRPFSQDWRVPEDERIFEGVLPEEEPEEFGRYCKCNHVVLRGVQCTCGPGELVETCDLNMNGEITANVSALFKRSRKSYDGDYNIGLDDLDIDEDFEPPELEWAPGAVWNETSATQRCTALISDQSTNALIQQCADTQGDDFVEEARWHCIEDIQITDTSDWQYSAVESAKRKCTSHYLRGIDLGDDYLTYANNTCLNDCNGRGECLNGTCHCGEGWTGGDCSLPQDEQQVVVMDDSSLCDTRVEDCSFATVFGRYFPADGSLSCQLKEAKLNSNGHFDISNKNQETDEMLYVSPYQVACKLPRAGSYEVTLLWNNQPLTVTTPSDPDLYAKSFIFMVHDSACYDCSLDEQTCHVRGPVDGVKDHCMIKSSCYAPGQLNPDDDCRYCNNTERDDDWTWHTDETCEAEKEEYIKEEERAKTEKIIRISTAVFLTLVIIVCTIIIYIYNSKNKAVDMDQGVRAADGDVQPAAGDVTYSRTNGFDNEAMQMNETSLTKIVPPQIQRIKDMESGHQSRKSSVSSIGSATDLEQAKKAAQEKRKRKSRSDSTSSTISVRSIGLGAGGAVHYSHYNKLVDDDSELEPTKGMGGHASPSLPTKADHHKGLHINIAF